MIFREFSNAALRFSLRRPGAEIMGGGGAFNQQAVENLKFENTGLITVAVAGCQSC